MYKAGKKWVVATLFSIALGTVAMTVQDNHTVAHASDQNGNSSVTATSLSTSTDKSNSITTNNNATTPNTNTATTSNDATTSKANSYNAYSDANYVNDVNASLSAINSSAATYMSKFSDFYNSLSNKATSLSSMYTILSDASSAQHAAVDINNPNANPADNDASVAYEHAFQNIGTASGDASLALLDLSFRANYINTGILDYNKLLGIDTAIIPETSQDSANSLLSQESSGAVYLGQYVDSVLSSAQPSIATIDSALNKALIESSNAVNATSVYATPGYDPDKGNGRRAYRLWTESGYILVFDDGSSSNVNISSNNKSSSSNGDDNQSLPNNSGNTSYNDSPAFDNGYYPNGGNFDLYYNDGSNISTESIAYNNSLPSAPDSTAASYSDYVGFPGYDPNNPSLYPGYTFNNSDEAMSAYSGAYNPVNNLAVANSLAMRDDSSVISSLSFEISSLGSQIDSNNNRAASLTEEIKSEESIYKEHHTKKVRTKIKKLKKSKNSLLKKQSNLIKVSIYSISIRNHYEQSLQEAKQLQPQYEEEYLHVE